MVEEPETQVVWYEHEPTDVCKAGNGRSRDRRAFWLYDDHERASHTKYLESVSSVLISEDDKKLVVMTEDFTDPLPVPRASQ